MKRKSVFRILICAAMAATLLMSTAVACFALDAVTKTLTYDYEVPDDTGVTAKGRIVFYAGRGDQVEEGSEYTWMAALSDGEEFFAVDLEGIYDGLSVYGWDTQEMTLDGIPLSMNGVKIYCVVNDADGESHMTRCCQIYVSSSIPAATSSSPSPTPTAAPTPSPTLEPTPEPTPEVTPEPTPEVTVEPTAEPAAAQTQNASESAVKNATERAADATTRAFVILIIAGILVLIIATVMLLYTNGVIDLPWLEYTFRRRK